MFRAGLWLRLRTVHTMRRETAMSPRLIDTTLREGAQAPVRYLTTAQKIDLIHTMAAIGIEEIELGHAVTELAYGAEPLSELMDAAADHAPQMRRAIWCRARREDIEFAASLGPEVISFALPVSDRHLVRRLGRNRLWALDQVAELTKIAHDAGAPYVSVGLEDATRADFGFLQDVAGTAAWAEADRLRLADTVGVASPSLITGLIAELATSFAGDIGVHLHNDFGMATANSIAALQGGAAWADVSLLGMGERAGIARLEEVLGWLSLQTSSNYDLYAACQAAARYASWIEQPIPQNAPVIGTDIFTCESGLHVAGIATDPGTYEPYPPEAVGATRHLRLGRHSGRSAVAALLPERQDDLTSATAEVRAQAAQGNQALAEDHLDALRRTSA